MASIGNRRLPSNTTTADDVFTEISRYRVETVADITGLWSRSLIRWPDGSSDTATSVFWMQTPSLFVDLRQPSDRPSFSGVQCLRDLRRDHLGWLACQEGFAGQIHFDGTFFEWQRDIDLQPVASFADAGRFWFESDIMVEEGRDVSYIEHWHREAPALEPCAGIRMKDAERGCLGIVVRFGDLFMYARRRMGEVPLRGKLIDYIERSANLREAQDLVDCEISFGRVENGGWLIERSSLPYKENQLLGLQARGSQTSRVSTTDIVPTGEPLACNWDIMDIQGALTDVLAAARG
jgi:hypothetical protein